MGSQRAGHDQVTKYSTQQDFSTKKRYWSIINHKGTQPTLTINMLYLILWASLVAQWLSIQPQYRRHRFNPWARKSSWRRKWQPTPVFLPGESHGQRKLVGYSPWGCKEQDKTQRINHLVLIIDSFNGHREEKVVLAITGINKTIMRYSNIWRVLSLGIL